MFGSVRNVVDGGTGSYNPFGFSEVKSDYNLFSALSVIRIAT